MSFFEQQSDSGLVQRSGADNSPSSGIAVGPDSAPVSVDWDMDGDLDKVVGSLDYTLSHLIGTQTASLVQGSGADNPPFWDRCLLCFCASRRELGHGWRPGLGRRIP